jgi:hypothetical protein
MHSALQLAAAGWFALVVVTDCSLWTVLSS